MGITNKTSSIVSKSHINKLRQKAKLLKKWLVEIVLLSKKNIHTRESKLKGRP